jgi:tetratricopeptide (TPR) repeat protein
LYDTASHNVKGGDLEHEHLDQATLERLLAVDRTEDQNRVLLHQLAVCPECYRVGGYILDLHRNGYLPLNFSVVDVELARSRAEAPRLWESLRQFPQSRRLSLAQSGNPFLTWGFCEFLCKTSKALAAQNPDEAVEIADLAVLVAEGLSDEGMAEERWLYQLRALAWAHLGNAKRVRGDLPPAESAFGVSEQWWDAGDEGTGDALGYRPILLDLKASLWIDQRRFPAALKLLDEAHDLYLEQGSPHLAGRVLLNQTHAFLESGEPDQAIPVLEKAEALIDPAREPRLLLCARHNLLDNLSKAGRFAEARQMLPQVQALSRIAGSQLDHVRLRWIEARIAAGLGDVEDARAAFSDARQGFLDQDIAYDAALVSLESAAVLLHQGRTKEVRELAREMIPIFQSQEIHREALAALAVFQAAAALDSATVELARDVAAFLVQARHDPGLRFRTE